MDAKILFMTNRYGYEHTLNALDRLKLDCITKVVVYESFRQISSIFEENSPNYDAVMISGSGAKKLVELKCPGNKKPIVSYHIDADGLHRDLLSLAIERQNLDFSRIAVDCLMHLNCGYSVVDFLRFTEADADPNKDTKLNFIAFEENAEISEKYILERILELWESKAIDMVLCLYPSIVPALENYGIPFRCPFISDAKLYELIQKVLVMVELKQMHDNHPAIVQIFPKHFGADGQERVQQIYACIQGFVEKNHIAAVVQENGQCCAIISSMGVLRYLTNEFKLCRITSYLEREMKFPVSVAYGIGTNISHAMNNVQIASKEAKILGKSFAVDSNGNLIGPLDSDSNMTISAETQADVSDIARRCNLSSMTIQKIQNILRNNGSDKITIPKIAKKMDTTVRNANRIMLNLCKGNVAKPVYTQTSHSRGRPVQVYMLDFDA